MMAEGGEKSDENVVNEDLVVKRNSTSASWTYFGINRDDMLHTQVLCKTCRAIVATSRGNTTNFHHHQQYNHKDLHEPMLSHIADFPHIMQAYFRMLFISQDLDWSHLVYIQQAVIIRQKTVLQSHDLKHQPLTRSSELVICPKATSY